jgi:hypothetical protein
MEPFEDKSEIFGGDTEGDGRHDQNGGLWRRTLQS